jgi:hypothetical protein
MSKTTVAIGVGQFSTGVNRLITTVIDNPVAVVQSVRSDEYGSFMFADPPPGEYAIRALFSGFASAHQNVFVNKAKPHTGCKKPVRVRLQPAGYYSSVSLLEPVTVMFTVDR